MMDPLFLLVVSIRINA